MAKKKGLLDAVKENLGMGSPMDDSSNDNKDPKKDTSPDDNKDPKNDTKPDDGKEPDKDPKKDTKSDGNKEPDKDSKKDAKTDSSKDSKKDSKKDSRSDTKTDTNDPDDDLDDADNADDDTGSKRSINDVSKAIIDDIVNSGGDAASKDDSDQPKEARNMRGLKFYEKVAEKIHDYDATGVMAPELKDWIATAIEDEKELSEMLVRRALPRVLAKNPGLIKEAKEVVKAAANHGPVPFKYFFVNAKDSSDKKEYATLDEARESIRKEIDLYGVDPKQVFRVIYRRVDASGKLGEIVSADVVETYIENFDGDKNTLRQTLRLPKKDNKNPSNGQQRKKGTAANNAANNSDSSNTSSHNGTGKS